MTNQSTNIYRLLEELTKDVGSYYLKEKELNNYKDSKGHIIYSHFKPYRGKITETLLQQHLQKEITLAISVKNSNILLFEYRGENGFAFGALLFRLIDKKKFSIYIIEYSANRLTLYIKPNKNENLDSIKEKLENDLEAKMSKEWRVYPIKNRSDLGNLMILPREFIESPWLF